MPSDTSRGTADAEQRDVNSSASASTSVPASTSSEPEPSSDVDRFRQWLAAYALHVETSLAVASVLFGVLAIPIVAFGSLAALGAKEGTPILDIGLVVAFASLASVVALATAVLVDVFAQLRRRGLPPTDSLGALTVAYVGARTVEALTAGAFLAGLLGSVVSSLALGRVPGLLGLTVWVSGISLPVIVFAHAAGAFVRYVLNAARDGTAAAG